MNNLYITTDLLIGILFLICLQCFIKTNGQTCRIGGQKFTGLNAVQCFFQKNKLYIIKIYSITLSIFIFFITLNKFCMVDNHWENTEYILTEPSQYSSFWFFSTEIYLDPVSQCFVLLTVTLIPLCILISIETIFINLSLFIILLFLIEYFLICAFSATSLVFFYISFESVLIPMFFIIGLWGSRTRRVLASYYIFIYTVVGSILFLLGIIYILLYFNTDSYYTLYQWFNFATVPSDGIQILIFKLFFIAFAVKVPMYPFHLWLPEAHVEAPTAGSVILAGLLLKLGGYGFYRFLLSLFPFGVVWGKPYIYTIALISILFSSLTALRQIDLKKIIAYSSIAHMNFGILGLFSFYNAGIVGSIFLMIGHGLVSSALFIIIGSYYFRYKTRILEYYGGLATVMPIFTVFFFLFAISNFAFPGTVNFVGEMLVFSGIVSAARIFILLVLLGSFLGTAYTILVFAKVSFGELVKNTNRKYLDILNYEYIVLGFLGFFTIFFGIYPNYFLNMLGWSVWELEQHLFGVFSTWLVTTKVRVDLSLLLYISGIENLMKTPEWLAIGPAANESDFNLAQSWYKDTRINKQLSDFEWFFKKLDKMPWVPTGYCPESLHPHIPGFYTEEDSRNIILNNYLVNSQAIDRAVEFDAAAEFIDLDNESCTSLSSIWRHYCNTVNPNEWSRATRITFIDRMGVDPDGYSHDEIKVLLKDFSFEGKNYILPNENIMKISGQEHWTSEKELVLLDQMEKTLGITFDELFFKVTPHYDFELAKQVYEKIVTCKPFLETHQNLYITLDNALTEVNKLEKSGLLFSINNTLVNKINALNFFPLDNKPGDTWEIALENLERVQNTRYFDVFLRQKLIESYHTFENRMFGDIDKFNFNLYIKKNFSIARENIWENNVYDSFHPEIELLIRHFFPKYSNSIFEILYFKDVKDARVIDVFYNYIGARYMDRSVIPYVVPTVDEINVYKITPEIRMTGIKNMFVDYARTVSADEWSTQWKESVWTIFRLDVDKYPHEIIANLLEAADPINLRQPSDLLIDLQARLLRLNPWYERFIETGKIYARTGHDLIFLDVDVAIKWAAQVQHNKTLENLDFYLNETMENHIYPYIPLLRKIEEARVYFGDFNPTWLFSFLNSYNDLNSKIMNK